MSLSLVGRRLQPFVSWQVEVEVEAEVEGRWKPTCAVVERGSLFVLVFVKEFCHKAIEPV